MLIKSISCYSFFFTGL